MEAKEGIYRGKWKILLNYYLYYKLFNSLFLGLSVGTIFVIYQPLDPSIYSLGGVILAIAMLIVAQLYEKIMSLSWFFTISLAVEIVALIMVLLFLYKPYTWQSAILIYIGYQITFTFGSYLMRAETLALDSDRWLKRVDSAKQIGYLAGMAISYIFYKILEYFSITNSQEKVYNIHYLLLIDEILIIYLLLKSFTKIDININKKS